MYSLKTPDRAVFLDRDGTINKEVSYLSREEDIEILAGACEGIELLKKNGFKIIVITNQSGVARGYFDEQRVMEINKRIGEMLAEKKAAVDRWYYCPHHPEAVNPVYRKFCRCRKPECGMIEQAAQDMCIDLKRSFMAGDTLRDIEAGVRAGCRSILVTTGHEDASIIQEIKRDNLKKISYIAKDLLDAGKWIVNHG